MNFALILFLATLLTGAVALLDRLVFARRRPAGEPEPSWVEYPKSFFPVLLIVFLLRSFVAEPFKIPSSSMRPTLEVGDFILVNKFTYGIRLPIIEKKIIDINQPQRGDVLGDEVTYRNKQLIINGQPQPLKPDGSYSYLEGTLAFVTTQRLEEKLGN